MKPIIMSTEDVRGILDGRRTMARMPIKPQPEFAQVHVWGGKVLYDSENRIWCWKQHVSPDCWNEIDWLLQFAPYKTGDLLWVRETWCPCATINGWLDDVSLYGYKADYDRVVPWKWRPSIHMPREAARLFLRVKDVRVERVQDILCGDMKREGVIPKTVTGGQYQQWQNDYFKPAWDARNAKRGFGWDVNPFVWVITFERITEGESRR